MAASASPVLSEAQLATLAQLGEERIAAVGETLFEVGDRRYPFVAIIEGEVAVQDGAGNVIVRHGASGFLGETARCCARLCSRTARWPTCCSRLSSAAAKPCSSTTASGSR